MVSPPRNFVSIFETHQVRQTLPIGGSIGKDQKGHFRTATLKEYPSALCRSLAHVIVQHVAERGYTAQLDDCPEDIMEKFRCLVGHLDQSVQELGPDYNPAAIN